MAKSKQNLAAFKEASTKKVNSSIVDEAGNPRLVYELKKPSVARAIVAARLTPEALRMHAQNLEQTGITLAGKKASEIQALNQDMFDFAGALVCDACIEPKVRMSEPVEGDDALCWYHLPSDDQDALAGAVQELLELLPGDQDTASDLALIAPFCEPGGSGEVQGPPSADADGDAGAAG